jgi:hypothetical protein
MKKLILSEIKEEIENLVKKEFLAVIASNDEIDANQKYMEEVSKIEKDIEKDIERLQSKLDQASKLTQLDSAISRKKT